MHPTLAAVALMLIACAGVPDAPNAVESGAAPGQMKGPPVCPPGCINCDRPTGRCHDCQAAQNSCQNGDVVSCNPNGTWGKMVKHCGDGSCVNGACRTACDAAAESHSYIGCDYWPTTTLTSRLNPEFEFAVAIANPLVQEDGTPGGLAQVTITRGLKQIAQRTVAPGTVETIVLPWVQELAQLGGCVGLQCYSLQEKSVRVEGGAYHLVSTLPVTVYQFSPLQFEQAETANCWDWPKTGVCHSLTNDASILLPSTALGEEYLVMARQSMQLERPVPGFAAIVATADNTKVTVTSSAYTASGPGVPELSPGSVANYSLMKGDVLELVSAYPNICQTSGFCDLGPKYDLTGTRINSDKPIQVIGGHACSYVPYNAQACDHLEEQISPLATWGKTVAVAQTRPQTLKDVNLWRILSGSDQNQITFDPPTAHGPVKLNAGQYLEFAFQGAFQAQGTGRVAVGQYMVGQVFTGAKVGDPSMGLGVPVEQYRSSYDFLSPATYTKNDLTVIAPLPAKLTLDGQAVPSSPFPIGDTGLGYRYIALLPGAHHITGSAPFGITVSGIAAYTSYLFVGGQALNKIAVQ